MLALINSVDLSGWMLVANIKLIKRVSLPESNIIKACLIKDISLQGLNRLIGKGGLAV